MSVVGLLKVVSFNGWSIRNKLTFIMAYLTDEDVDIAFVQETWIRKSDGNLLTEIREYGYEVITYRKTRKLDLGGGVAVIYKNRLKIRNIKCKNYPSFEHIQCQLTTEKGPINFINIYRPEYSTKHRFTTKKFLQDFSDLLDPVASSNVPYFLVGDYNIHVELAKQDVLANQPTSFVNKINNAKMFIKVLNENNITQLIDEETHDLHGTLDLLLTQTDNVPYIQNLSIGYKGEICKSDHFPVKFHLQFKPSFKDDKVTITRRNFTNFDANLFQEEVKKYLTPEKLGNNDINYCVKLYEDSLRSALDQQCPMVTQTVHNRPNQLWFDSNLRDMKRKKRAVEREWRKNPTTQLLNKLNTVKNHYKNACFNTRTTHISTTIDKFKDDKKKLHNMVKYLTGTKQEKMLPSFTSKEALANQMTQFYHTKIQNIRKEIQSINNTEYSELQLDQCDSTFTDFKSLDKEKLKVILSSMNATGHPHDPIPVWILKHCFEELSTVLLNIINRSLIQECTFPDRLKHAVVTPMLKGKDGSTEAFENYRPVSTLTFLSKLIEKCACTQIQCYLSENNLYPKCQSAYRKNHSCETALLKVVNDIQIEISNKKMVALIALDLSSAFDTIDHSLLTNKLKKDFGISNNVLKWLNSYLTNRTFAVRIIDVEGQPVLLLFGVPQGSILGPLLFILYIHDMARIAADYGLKIHFYADDSEMYIGFSPLTEASQSMLAVKQCLDVIKCWMHANFLKINMDKTKVMFFGRHQELSLFTVHVNIEGKYFESGMDMSLKTLGIKLDSKLCMQKMVSECVKNCYFQLKHLQGIRRCLTINEKITMVHTNILSRLDYGNVLLASSSASLIQRYQKVMNACVRFIYNLRKTQFVNMYQKQCHFLPAKYRIMYKSCLIIFKILNNLSPDYLNTMALLQVQTRENLRSNTDYMLLKYPDTQKCLQYHLVKNWNNLPYMLRCSSTVDTFKSSLKTHYFRLAYDV